jgi:hypothetical protein
VDIALLSKSPATINLFTRLARRLNVRLVLPGADEPLPLAALLADADTYPDGPAQRARLVDLLCRYAAHAPVACFGYLLTDPQRTALEEAGVLVSRGPGRSLLRTLALWQALDETDVLLEADEEENLPS